MKLLLVILSFAAFATFNFHCKSPKIENPSANGILNNNSDARAIALADAVLRANGGLKNWDDTRYLVWNFFGNRKLWWDKHQGRVRIEFLKKNIKILVNLHDGTGKVQLDGVEQHHPDSLAKYVDMGKKIWINDSYWLVMPFKLKDKGVNLSFLGFENTQENLPAEVLQLTFEKVGVTPDNKYKVWIDPATHRVVQWAYFEKFTDEMPRLINAWTDYQKFGNIWLSGGRGNRQITEIDAPEYLDENVFLKF